MEEISKRTEGRQPQASIISLFASDLPLSSSETNVMSKMVCPKIPFFCFLLLSDAVSAYVTASANEEFMRSYDNDKRIRRRMKQEFVVGVRTAVGLHLAYTIDVSRGGIKIGSPVLQLPLGVQVDLVIDKRGEKYPFSGHVVREDGNYYIDRIRRSVTAFFIKIDDLRFSEFAIDNYFV